MNAAGSAKHPTPASATRAIERAPIAPVAESPAMRLVLAAAEDVAVGSTTVLILGESGTGKEILARHIHRCSPRAARAWVAVNCAALPTDLLEGELFGHERGAFTGAFERRIGRIEQADGGTLLLDEISELPLGLQAKLLRVLQEREVDRLGGTRPIPVDVRVIATSNRPLGEMVARKEFRADLFYRLDVFPIRLPPLRDRPQDIRALTDELMHVLAKSLGRQAPVMEPAAIEALGAYPFPGNVRELGNIIERALVRCRQPVLRLGDLDLPRAAADAGDGPGRSEIADLDATPAHADGGGGGRFPDDLPLHLPTLERLAIDQALRLTGGNRTHAARRLGISLRTLRNKLRLYREAAPAGGQPLPGTNDLARVTSPSLARPSQSTSSRRMA